MAIEIDKTRELLLKYTPQNGGWILSYNTASHSFPEEIAAFSSTADMLRALRDSLGPKPVNTQMWTEEQLKHILGVKYVSRKNKPSYQRDFYYGGYGNALPIPSSQMPDYIVNPVVDYTNGNSTGGLWPKEKTLDR